MTQLSTTAGWSPSVRKALLWASGTAALDGNHRPITSDDLFIGLLLAHPDPQGEIWQFLGHFGLTARDVLPDDRPVLDHNALRSAAAAARGPDVSDWSSDVSTIMGEAGERAGGTAQVLHVLASLLGRPPWPQRLQPGLARFGISATELVSEFGNVIPSLRSVDPEQDTDTIDLQSDTTAGEQIGQWLARRFPRQPATMASISNDAPDPSADFVGVGSEADAFAYLITSKTLVPPLAIGLFGTWGSGKSFLMTKIRHRVGQLTTMAASRSESQRIWSKVVPIEFNAWQYVETDLWAALLSRIYGELSPEARAKLTELGRRRLEQQGEEAANREELVHAREKLEDLVATQEKQVEALRTATEQVTNAKRQADDLAVVRAALDTDARAALRGMAINEVRARLGTEVTAFIEEAHRLKVAASVPAWKHGKFWSRGRTVWPLALYRGRQFMDQVEDYWERGPGSSDPSLTAIMHNLSVYGWDLRDALEVNAASCRTNLKQPKDDWLKQAVENSSERAALRVYPATDANANMTLFDAAAALGNETNGGDAGIETLVVFLGANNALGSVVSLNVAWSGTGYDHLDTKGKYTVWRPDHFKSELAQVEAEIRKIKARHVIWCTVPHVTIVPLARGVHTKIAPKSRYYRYYTRPWITDDQFDPTRDPHITADEARAVDCAIDQYNDAITDVVRAARTDKNDPRDWYLFDTAGLLDRLAQRRYIEDPLAQPSWWKPYALPAELGACTPPLNSKFISSDGSHRDAGGLFSLDGVHPTTVAYGILAQELINVMRIAGVEFRTPNGDLRPDPVLVDFNRLIRRDTLINTPPAVVDSSLSIISWADEALDVIRRTLTFAV